MQIPPHGKKFKNNCKLIRCVSVRVRGRILDEGRAHTVDEGGHVFPLKSESFKIVPSKALVDQCRVST